MGIIGILGIITIILLGLGILLPLLGSTSSGTGTSGSRFGERVETIGGKLITPGLLFLAAIVVIVIVSNS
jgi:hypothetical protein